MLAKQAWRIVKNPNSLVAQIFKARYYPYCSFWEANLSDSPSFSWRSIVQSRPVLAAGVHWKVGDGTQIQIWTDDWIPEVPRYRVHKPPNCEIQFVHELINHDSRTWNVQVISSLFPPDITLQICSIPLSRRVLTDRMIWKPEKRGFYTVKSAYWIARSTVMPNALASTSSGNAFLPLWKKLWKARVPGKVMHCAWRACHDLLPTRAKLVTKGYEGTLKCLSCPHPCETTAHLVCACPIAQTILLGSHLNITVLMSSIFNFKEWMIEQATSLSDDKFQKLLLIIWGLWRNRNNMLWSDKQQTAQEIICGTMSWYHEFTTINYPQQKPSKTSQRVKWFPPAVDHLKLNVDGAFMPNETEGGVGGILRDNQGIVVAAFTKHISGINSANQAELEAIRAGLIWLKTYNFHNCILETDCQVAVNEVQLQDYISLEYGNIIDDIHELLEGFDDVYISFAPRTAKAAAHRLASDAFESVGYVQWMDAIPYMLRDTLKHDCNNILQ
ncbi:hypothetical protein ACLB2K_068900 [Fragaria x ananassa]